MKRREFLGGMAFAGMAWMGSPQLGGNSIDVDWQCDAIQTVGQPPKLRAPVVTGVSLDPSESTLAVVGDDHFVSLYDLGSKRFNHVLRGHTDWVRTTVFSPDGKALYSAGNDRRCLVWNPLNWSAVQEFTTHPAAILDLACHPTKPQLAIVGFESALRVYSTETMELIRSLYTDCDDLRCVAYSPDGKMLAIGGRDGTVRVWETQNWNSIADMKAHRQRIRSLEFLPSGQIVTGSEDQFVRISDLQSNSVVLELPRFPSKLFDVVVIDDHRIVTGGSDNQVSVWDTQTGKKQGALLGHTGTVSCLCAGKSLLISGSYDTQVRVWHREAETTALPRQTNATDGWKLK